MVFLKYARLHEGAVHPVRKHPDDAGVDVTASADVRIAPFSAGVVPTGLTFEVPQGYMLLAKPKSKSDLLLGAGVIDAGYQGEIKIKVINYTPVELRIFAGDPIAQLVQVPVVTLPLQDVGADIHKQPSMRGATGGILE